MSPIIKHPPNEQEGWYKSNILFWSSSLDVSEAILEAYVFPNVSPIGLVLHSVVGWSAVSISWKSRFINLINKDLLLLYLKSSVFELCSWEIPRSRGQAAHSYYHQLYCYNFTDDDGVV